MTHKIIEDSCFDLIKGMKEGPRFQMISLTSQVGSTRVIDDKAFDQGRFVEIVKACPEYPKITYPSPEILKTVFAKTDTETVFVTTLSNHLSGSYNLAAVVKRLYEGETAEKGVAEQAKKMVVIDLFSTSSGELNTALFIQNLCDPGLKFDEVVEKTLAYRGDMSTCFVLESLDTLRKDGRLPGLQTFFVIALNIKPVMDAGTGTIIKLSQVREMNKTPRRMCDIAAKEMADAAGKIAVICHVDNPERAEYVKNRLAERVGFKKTVVINTADVTAVCVDDGGVILTA